MKKIVLSQIVLSMVLMNCQEERVTNSKIKNKISHEVKHTFANHKDLDLIDIQFGESIVDMLSRKNLPVISNEWVTNMDYEEYNFPINKKINILIAGHLIDFNKSEVKILYLKDTKKIFLCDIEIFNDTNSVQIINDVKNRLDTEPSFFKKSINTPEHPTTIDENGEPEKDHVEKMIQVLKNKQNTTTHFMIYENNITKNERKLRIILLDRNSSKYKEYLDGLSFFGYKE